ncbi:hypothetical protein LR48_Vigan06g103900 [Vigna angularis]|uniref:Uncharacterized protein n=1 Tax=Phaseolus angularis TaxID=3914 RepID=A0A0L9USK0_PHAAN|nr:hypothetical protein LR48_Vigan06g103900 [Vigna angularis]
MSPSSTLDRNEKVEQYIKMKDLLTHCLKGNLLLDRPNSGIRARFVLMTGSDEYNDPYTESLPGKGYLGKQVPLRYGPWKGLLMVVLPLEGECTYVEGTHPLGGDVGNSSVSPSPILDRNEKVE